MISWWPWIFFMIGWAGGAFVFGNIFEKKEKLKIFSFGAMLLAYGVALILFYK